MPSIPYFHPPHAAVTKRCQLCGKAEQDKIDAGNPQIGAEEFITERVRGIQMRAEAGDYNFCRPCSAIAAEVGQRIEAFRARVLAEAERQVAAELVEAVPRWIAELQGAPLPDEAPKKRGPVKRTSSMIPEPNGA